MPLRLPPLLLLLLLLLQLFNDGDAFLLSRTAAGSSSSSTTPRSSKRSGMSSSSSTPSAPGAEVAGGSSGHVVATLHPNRVLELQLNRPRQLNALSVEVRVCLYYVNRPRFNHSVVPSESSPTLHPSRCCTS